MYQTKNIQIRPSQKFNCCFTTAVTFGGSNL